MTYHLERTTMARHPSQRVLAMPMPPLGGELQQAVEGRVVAARHDAVQLSGAAWVTRRAYQQGPVRRLTVAAGAVHEDATTKRVQCSAALHLDRIEQLRRQCCVQPPRAPPQTGQVARVRHVMAPRVPQDVEHAAAWGLRLRTAEEGLG
ncbi:hypothetical protein PG993_002898 [Apiospora rasikravindrae]|uniref:Uncharacterized protein n=1 Tax=Apiospora rasikravindrae TaxID=990691 RepID=A0ABR1U0M5_9PEZI